MSKTFDDEYHYWGYKLKIVNGKYILFSEIHFFALFIQDYSIHITSHESTTSIFNNANFD